MINAPTDPIAWVRRHVLPLFGVSLAMSADGWYFYALRTDATANDCVAVFDADAGRVVRASPVQSSPWSEITNAVTLAWRTNAITGRGTATVYVDGADVSPSFGLYAHIGSAAARWSASMPWGFRPVALETSIVYSPETARDVALSYVERNAAPSTRVVYTSGPEHLGIYPGAYVLVRDHAAGLEGRVCRVVGRSILPARHAGAIRVAHTVATLPNVRGPRAVT